MDGPVVFGPADRLETLMTYYKVEMKHNEESFEALAHMQYDLFCGKNRTARTFLSLVLVIAGAMNFSSWWGILIVAYGCYLSTSTYSSANHTAHKLSAQIKETGMPFPSSRYVFRDKDMEIVPLPEQPGDESRLAYADVCRLGEDLKYYYIFRDQFGGYMVPKEALGDREADFRTFLEGKTGLTFRIRTAPIIRFLRRVGREKPTSSRR